MTEFVYQNFFPSFTEDKSQQSNVFINSVLGNRRCHTCPALNSTEFYSSPKNSIDKDECSTKHNCHTDISNEIDDFCSPYPHHHHTFPQLSHRLSKDESFYSIENSNGCVSEHGTSSTSNMDTGSRGENESDTGPDDCIVVEDCDAPDDDLIDKTENYFIPSRSANDLSSVDVNTSNGVLRRSSVLIFVYGTLKRGYCNHYNLETDGIKFFQEGLTVHPYVLYLDSSNRLRPCLTDGAACPINEIIDPVQIREDETAGNSQLICPFCCSHETQHSKRLNATAEINAAADLSPTTKYSKHWGLPVRGELYFLNSSLLPALDRFERVPAHYIRRTIPVRGMSDNEFYNAEVYFNKTSCQRWIELLVGRFRLLRNYTLDHHRLYKPRTGNNNGLNIHQSMIK